MLVPCNDRSTVHRASVLLYDPTQKEKKIKKGAEDRVVWIVERLNPQAELPGLAWELVEIHWCVRSPRHGMFF